MTTFLDARGMTDGDQRALQAPVRGIDDKIGSRRRLGNSVHVGRAVWQWVMHIPGFRDL